MIFLLLSPIRAEVPPRETNGLTHIEIANPMPDTFVMLCGVVAEEDDDGNIDIDFYTFTWGRKATCRDCRRVAGFEAS